MTTPPPAPKPRWVYRFDNYRRAFTLLREAIELMDERELSQLEQEGIIQRFEYTWELAWKLIKDYLDASGVVLPTITPAAVIKAAYAARVIDHGETWLLALDARNKMSHTYDFAAFARIIADIRAEYLTLLDALQFAMLERVINDGHA